MVPANYKSSFRMAALSLMFQARNFFFYMILIIFMLGFGSCQRSTLSHDSRMPSRFYIDPEQKSSPMEMFGKLDSFDTWKPRLLNQMRNDLGNVWFSVKLPESDHEKVLEFQTLNLIDLEAYWIKEDGSLQILNSIDNPVSQHHSFRIPIHGGTKNILIMSDQYTGGFFLGFYLYENPVFEQKKLFRSLLVGLVIGLFLLSLLMTALVNKNYNQIWLLILILSGIFGVFLEKRLYTFFDIHLDSLNYIKGFIFQLSLSSIAYLRIISHETKLITQKTYHFITRSIELLILLLFIVAYLIIDEFYIFEIIPLNLIPLQLTVLGFLLTYFYCTFLLLNSWKKKPHLQEFTVAYILVYSTVVVTNLSVKGLIPPDFNLWDGNYRAVIPLILSLILYKKRELKFREMANLLKIQDKNKDLFLARTSHELRTPLSGMIGLCENILEKAEGIAPSFVRKLELVVHSGRRMNQLIGDLTDFTHMRDGNLKIHCQSSDFEEILHNVMPTLKPEIERKNLIWKVKMAQELPPIFADQERIQQVLFNLIGNAIKYTQNGYITLETQIKDSFIEVSLEDSGMGIPAEELNMVLEDFQRGTNVTTAPGTGLGLSLSRYIIELHQGDFSIESDVGKGTRLRFTLPSTFEKPPQKEAEATSDSSWMEVQEPTQESNETNATLTYKAKVVIVDDEPVNLEIIEGFLEEMSLEMKLYSNGNDFLDHLSEDEPDLLILDLMMPNMDGYSVIRQIRSEFSPLELPILVVTANEQERISHHSLSLGANDYLIKPLVGMELRMRVQSQLSLSRQHRLQESLEDLEKQKMDLRRDKGRMKMLLDSIDACLAVTDSKGNISYINRAFERMFGYAENEIKQKDISSLFLPPFIPPSQAYTGAQTFLHKSGSQQLQQLTVKPLEFSDHDDWVYTFSDSENMDKKVLKNSTDNENLSSEPIQSVGSLRQYLTNLLQLSVKYYRLTTGESQNELAEKSGCWHITMNGSTPRAYMLERYMDPKRIPKNPNWAIVLKTSNWVLEECPENQPLKTEIMRVKDSIEQSIILK